MTYDVYAMFREGSYKVAEGSDQNHVSDFAERVCAKLGVQPMAMATLTRGEHTLRGKIFSIEDLMNQGKGK
jgi:hypothetical protein